MAIVRVGDCLRWVFASITAVAVILLAVSVLCVGGERVAAASELPSTLLEKRNRDVAELPGGMDPMDVVRMVQRNKVRERSRRDASGCLAPADGVGSAFHIGGDPVYGPAEDDQVGPAVAYDGTNYLVVWEDDRSLLGHDIYGTRVSVGGSVLDPAGIAISTVAENEFSPAVAFDGTNYLVVWEDYRNGTDPDIYGARVSVGGSVLDGAGIAISAASGNQFGPAVAFDGTDYLVVWEDQRSGSHYDIYGARVSVGGSVLDGAGIAISTASDNQSSPAVAFDGTDYLVVWEDYRSGSYYDIYGARVSVGGSVLDASGIAISAASSNQFGPELAFDGTNYLVAWTDQRNGSSGDIYGARVSVGGSVLDASGIAISAASNGQGLGAVASDGTNYLVVWTDHRSGSSYDIYGARVSVGGSVFETAGIAISTAAYDQYFPAIAFDGTNYLVVWEDCRGGSSRDIYGTRVSVDGSVLDASGIAISTAPNNQWYPTVAFGGTNYLVAWEDLRGGSSRDIYGARVSVGGSVLDTAGIAISTATNQQYYPALAFDGTNYLVVWEDYRSGSSYDYDIYATRVSEGGSVLDAAGIAISTATNGQCDPALCFDGTNYLVVWHDYRNGSSSDIYAARVSVGGSVLDAAGIAISTGESSQYSPAIAFDGTNYLVVWEDGRGSYYDIYGTRVSVGGSVLDAGGIAISTGEFYQSFPAVVFDGTNYLVVWQDNRSGSSLDICGARVTSGGVVVDADGLVISTATYNEKPAICRGISSTALVAYPSFMPTPYGSNQIWGNIWYGPTAIVFAAASATVEQGHVTLSWQMAVEAVASSFRIERSESQGGEFVTLALSIVTSSGFRFSCADYSVHPGKSYWYRIVLVGGPPEEFYGPLEVRVESVPVAYRAYQSYPNPFNPVSTIRYEIPKSGRVSLRVYDIAGKPVRIVVDAWCEPGVYSEVWDGKADDGSALPSGVYFYSIKAGDFVATRKMVLLR